MFDTWYRTRSALARWKVEEAGRERSSVAIEEVVEKEEGKRGKKEGRT